MRFLCSLLLFVGLLTGCRCARAATVVPIDYADGLVWLKVEVPGQREQLNFLLDSGAGISVIHTATARRLGLHLGSEERVQGVSGSVSAYQVAGFSAQVGSLPLPRRILALDLARVSATCHQRIDGLIGLDFLRQSAVELDFAGRTLRFVTSGEIKREGAVCLPLSRRNDAFGTLVSVQQGRAAWMRIDTGCTTALRWVADSRRAVAPPRASTTLGFTAPGGQYLNTEVQLGQLHLSNVRTGVHQHAMFPGEAGLIGNGLLSRFKVTIDVPGRQLLLQPRG